MVRRFRDWWERRGLTVPLIFAWFPFWAVLALVIGDRTIKLTCFWIGVAPLGLAAAVSMLAILALPLIASRPIERVGAILFFGVLAWWLVGWLAAAIYVAVIAALWLASDAWNEFRSRGGTPITPSAAAYRHAPHE